jgi:hypothetical protein
MQPTHNPWLGYFDLIDCSDLFIFLDNVQLEKRSWQVRNRILTQNGELFVTIPIKKTDSRDETTINSALIDDEQNWRKKYLKTLENSYKKSNYFAESFPIIEDIIDNSIKILSDYNINFITKICDKIGIKTTLLKSSEIPGIHGSKDELLVNICNILNCNEYISPQGSSVYIEKINPGGEFVNNGVNLFYHNFHHPIYKQLKNDFTPFVGIIDLIFNEGFENALNIIRTGRQKKINYIEFRETYLKKE